MGRLNYRRGDYLVQTDGAGVVAHRSECEMQYDGKLKLKSNVDPRHPQEFLFMKKEKQSVPIPRPISENQFSFTTDYTNL